MLSDTATYKVSCTEGAEANGVANILQMLLAQNFANKPELVKVARKMKRRPVGIISTDTDAEATLQFTQDGVSIYNGTVGKPKVKVYATVDQILDVSQLKMKGGGLLPVGFFTKRGGKVLGQIAMHKLVVKGLLSHTVASLRTIALLSIAR
ncbi:hypothetical protein CKJ67_19675 [Mycobacterium intracellulare]|uniref:hypothetical protein n=1 Tax=Mycobacterium intracellulare TaxID=1767 RepID=UPI000BAB13AB|nr:hypothetical protein [Mycobacterium intracellulare]ASW96768.1 hypothetical protein CKJ67_19675 [Mycobacterium intracellulare]PBA19505.1 hypothetical protein CKJ68_19490 [Mycobacterium intracellulare]